MRISSLSVSTLALVCVCPALAAELTPPSKIDAVTVFPDGAKITRLAELDVPEGDNVVILHGLTAFLDQNSLRVTGSAQEPIQIGAVEANIIFAPKPAIVVSEKLPALQNDRAALQVKIDALETKRAMISKYSSAPIDPKQFDLSTEKWTTAWNEVGNSLANVGEDIRQARKKAADLDLEIQAESRQRMIPQPQPQQTYDVSIIIHADKATKANLTLTYSVPGSSWTPLYDAKLDTGKRSLALTRRAAIRQRTGEDWSNVDLTLSTVRTARGTATPEMVTEHLNFYEPVPVAMEAAKPAASAAPMLKMRRETTMAQDSETGAAQNAPAAPAPAKAAEEAVAQTNLGTYAATYHLAGRFSVLNDASQKTVLISTAQLNPKLKITTTPALDASAFLSAESPNDLDAPLLAGEVSLLRDDTYIGKGRIAFTETGDTFTLGFGADDKVKITRAPVKKKENEPVWYNQTKTETREFKTTVKNLHDFPVSVQLFDRIPVSENTSITVEQLPLTTPPTEKQVGDKRGVMSWTLDVNPNESKDIRLGYRIKYPADRDIISTQ